MWYNVCTFNCITREKFRDAWDGILILINLIDATLFGRDSSYSQSHLKTEACGSTTAVTAVTTSVDEGESNRTSDIVKNIDDLRLQTPDNETRGDSSDAQSEKGAQVNFSQKLAPQRDSVYCLTAPLEDRQLALISEALKIVFNQTLHWRDDGDYDDVSMM